MSSGSILTPQSNNLYAYTQNNPIDFTDPSGLNRQMPTDSHEAIHSNLGNVVGVVNVSWDSGWDWFTSGSGSFNWLSDGNIGDPGDTGGGGGTQQDNPPRSGPCNLHTPKFDELNSLSGNPAALALLNNTYGNQARLYYNQMTPYNQAVFLNTVAAVNAQSPNLLSSAKFEGFYNGYKANADAFGINVSGVTAKTLDKEGLPEVNIQGKISRRSPRNIKEGSVEATVESNSVDFDVDLYNPAGGFEH